MRSLKIAVLGLSALLSARLVAGCSSGQGDAGYDAGSLEDVDLPAEDAGAGQDTSTPLQIGDASDATFPGEDGSALPTQDSGAPSDDGGADTSPGTTADAGDGAVPEHDAGKAADAGEGEPNAGDASAPVVDAGVDAAASFDAALPLDAATPVDATAPVDASDAATTEDASDAALSEDASEASSTEDASDAAPACVSCGTTLAFLGNTAAYVTGTATSVALQGGTVPDGAQATVVTQTYPQGSVGALHLIYSTASDFSNPVDLVMTFDHITGNNDQWYGILPIEAAGTTVSWYLRADGCDCATSLYGQPAPEVNYTYSEQ